ncbi:hypothetical protein AnigIFM56816_007221 [Aspergillus niger]|nr:hypothetical protein AnigIFM56816_007221 [Aspergillus niger]
MSGKYYATNNTNTFSTTMIIVMIKGASEPEQSAHRSRPFSDWQEHSTVERNPANRHGWLSGAIRAMSANRPTRRRDHRKAGGFQREETTASTKIFGRLNAHPQTDLSSRPILMIWMRSGEPKIVIKSRPSRGSDVYNRPA